MLVPRLELLHESVSVRTASGSASTFCGGTAASAKPFSDGQQKRVLNASGFHERVTVGNINALPQARPQQTVSQRVTSCGCLGLFEVKHERPIIGDVKQWAAVATAATRATGSVNKAQ